ncbi:MAG TPA: hypothetical protein PK819_07910 [Thermomicrobiales bacterium]|nr:hypothetical protein [Thermomicrobiales bacterium]
MDSSDYTAIVITALAIAACMVVVLVWLHNRSELSRLELESAAAIANDDRLRQLTNQSVAAQQVTAEEIARVRTEMASLGSRMATIEQLMRDVDS